MRARPIPDASTAFDHDDPVVFRRLAVEQPVEAVIRTANAR